MANVFANKVIGAATLSMPRLLIVTPEDVEFAYLDIFKRLSDWCAYHDARARARTRARTHARARAHAPAAPAPSAAQVHRPSATRRLYHLIQKFTIKVPAEK
eukprot:4670612-Prymnesium_polylepis.1